MRHRTNAQPEIAALIVGQACTKTEFGVSLAGEGPGVKFGPHPGCGAVADIIRAENLERGGLRMGWQGQCEGERKQGSAARPARMSDLRCADLHRRHP